MFSKPVYNQAKIDSRPGQLSTHSHLFECQHTSAREAVLSLATGRASIPRLPCFSFRPLPSEDLPLPFHRTQPFWPQACVRSFRAAFLARRMALGLGRSGVDNPMEEAAVKNRMKPLLPLYSAGSQPQAPKQRGRQHTPGSRSTNPAMLPEVSAAAQPSQTTL